MKAIVLEQPGRFAQHELDEPSRPGQGRADAAAARGNHESEDAAGDRGREKCGDDERGADEGAHGAHQLHVAAAGCAEQVPRQHQQHADDNAEDRCRGGDSADMRRGQRKAGQG